MNSSFFKIQIFIILCFLLFFGINYDVSKASSLFDEKFTQKIDENYILAAKDYRKLLAQGDFGKNIDNWQNTIQKFEAIAQDYPNFEQAPKALYNIGKLYKELYDRRKNLVYATKSNTAFIKLVNKYPNHKLSDDALKHTGDNQLYALNQKNDAKQTFLKLVNDYPSSEFLTETKNKLNKLKVVDDSASFKKASQTSPALLSQVLSINNQDEYFRLIFELNKRTDFSKNQVLSAKSGDTIVELGFKKVKLAKGLVKPNFNNKKLPIKDLKFLTIKEGLVKINLVVAKTYQAKVYEFENDLKHNVVVDLVKNTPARQTQSAVLPNKSDIKPSTKKLTIEDRKKLVNQAITNTSQITQDLSLAKILGLKIKTIVIDAGHGGKDPGAVAFGVREKNLTLKLALLLKKWLSKTAPDLNVVLTRSDDLFVSLEDRSVIANNSKGDLFISLHVNASKKKELFGVETYFLNFSDDARVLELAAAENASSTSSLSSLNDTISKVLKSSKMQESKSFANMVQEGLFLQKSIAKNSVDLGVKNAPFVVLVNSKMPSILVEVGFMSNKQELNWLLQVNYLNSIAKGIATGILEYVKRASNNPSYAAK